MQDVGRFNDHRSLHVMIGCARFSHKHQVLEVTEFCKGVHNMFFKFLLNCWWLVAYGHEFENYLLAFVGSLDPRDVKNSTLSRPKGASDEEVAGSR